MKRVADCVACGKNWRGKTDSEEPVSTRKEVSDGVMSGNDAETVKRPQQVKALCASAATM